MRQFFSALVFIFLSVQTVSAAPPLEAYGHLPAIKFMQLSPSGERYAFVAKVGEARRLMVLSDSGKVIFSQELGDLKARSIEWVNDDRLLLEVSTTFDSPLNFARAYEFYSLINVDLKTGKTAYIYEKTKKIAPLVMGQAGTVQLEGHPYKYFVGLAYVYSKGVIDTNRNGGYFFDGDHRNLYRVNLDTNEVSMQARGGDGPKYKWQVDSNGNVLVHSEYDQPTGIWRLYAGEDNTKLLLQRTAAFREIELLGLGRTPATVWVADSTSGKTVIEEISATDGKSETITDTAEPDDVLIDPDSKLAIGMTVAEEPRATFFEPKLQARLAGTRKAFPNLQMQLVSYSRNLDRLVVKTDGGDDSGTYWLVDIKSGKANPIGEEYPEVRAADVGPTQWLSYKAGDGLDIQAVLTLPPGRKAENLPLVVMPHRGPIGVEITLGFDFWAQAYASAGYAVLEPNYRGSGGKGKDFLQAGFGQWGGKMLTDISDGVTALSARGIADPKRVCIVGWDYGGYAALAGVTLQKNIYRCAVSLAGPADMPAFLRWQTGGNGYQSGPARYWRAVAGAEATGSAAMQAISPTNFAERADSPILLIHGTDDTVVPIAQSEQMESALRSAKKSVQFIKLEDEDHWLSRDASRTAMLKASVAFVKEHNPVE